MHWLSSLLNYFYACDVSSEKNLMFFFVRKAVEDRWEVVHSNSTLLFYLWVFPQLRDYSMSCVILRYASYLWYQRLQQLFSQTKAQGVKNSVLRLWFCWWIQKYTNKQISVFRLCECFFLRTPSYVYLFCPKSGFVGEYTNTHYKMTRILFVYL